MSIASERLSPAGQQQNTWHNLAEHRLMALYSERNIRKIYFYFYIWDEEYNSRHTQKWYGKEMKNWTKIRCGSIYWSCFPIIRYNKLMKIYIFQRLFVATLLRLGIKVNSIKMSFRHVWRPRGPPNRIQKKKGHKMTFCCAIKRDLCWNIIFKQYIYSERCETIVFSWFPYRRIRWIGLLEFPLLGFYFSLYDSSSPKKHKSFVFFWRSINNLLYDLCCV